MVNGVGLRLPSLRGSRVQIPPPALYRTKDGTYSELPERSTGQG